MPKYDHTQIAKEINDTALGNSYHGNALRVALDIPCIKMSPAHHCAIQRYLREAQLATDHIRLQEVAILLQKDAQHVPQPRRPKRRGRPRKPKRDHAVTLTLTLPNAAFRRHLQRLAKQSGHKTPGAFIAATFPLSQP